MSKATKRKHVQKELLCQDYEVPEDVNSIVKITQNSGNNLHQIETHSGDTYFVSMPGKFRNNIWIKPGDYVIVKPIEEGNKVKGEINQILDKKYISFLKQQKAWPFKQMSETNEKHALSDNEDSDSESDGLPHNLNRQPNVMNDFSETSSDDESH
uniref:Probable RNA-binding protein EIF1AD n=1 Tax=Cacopsylla melanoneura TaxID=428564 RepID=A0A8D8YU01_9HEMI